MRRPVLVLVAALTFGLISCTREATVSALDSQLEFRVVRAEFGLFHMKPDGRAEFTPSNTVPLRQDQSYGWVASLQSPKPTIRWKEEFSLPAAPKVWGEQSGASQAISSDRRISTIERVVAPKNGLILNAWSVAAGDPPGDYTIRLTVEDQPPITFRFVVQ
jgi:hypothetical protein